VSSVLSMYSTSYASAVQSVSSCYTGCFKHLMTFRLKLPLGGTCRCSVHADSPCAMPALEFWLCSTGSIAQSAVPQTQGRGSTIAECRPASACSIPMLLLLWHRCVGLTAHVSGRHKMSKVSQVADAYSNRHSYKAKKAVHGHGGGTSSGSAHTGHASGVRRQRREAATVVSGASKLSIGPSNASRVHLRHLADSGKYGYGGSGRYRLDV